MYLTWTRSALFLVFIIFLLVRNINSYGGDHSQRGDGFPLANMLAQVSVGAKDLVPVLTAHLYTVCPTAIPSLPHPAPDATEDQVMESLGMLRKKDGEFESFERFLSRTEVSGVGVARLWSNLLSVSIVCLDFCTDPQSIFYSYYYQFIGSYFARGRYHGIAALDAHTFGGTRRSHQMDCTFPGFAAARTPGTAALAHGPRPRCFSDGHGSYAGQSAR